MSLILVVMIVLGFTSCGDSVNSSVSSSITTSDNSSQAQTSSEEHEIESSNNSSNNKKPDKSSSGKASSGSSVSSVPSVSSSEKVESIKPTETSSEEAIPDAPDYKNISCRNVPENQWKSVRIKNSKKGIAAELKLPSDWTISANTSNSYTIFRSGKQIGIISTSQPKSAHEEFEHTSDTDFNNSATKSHQISWYYAEGEGKFYRVFTINDYPRTIYFDLYLQINYSELDSASADYLFKNAGTSSTIGSQPIPPLDKNSSSKEILILGNSFIGSSNIVNILNSMLIKENTGYTINAVAIGGAYTGTFLEDYQLCNDIRNGRYCYVFQCGLYSSLAVASFEDLKQIYDAADVPAVFFPAHNEDQSSINSALKQYYDMPILSWKAEIESLIDSGISEDTFCIDDGFKHSKPIAGYVGAHMIFRTLFGRIPSEDIDFPEIGLSKDYIRSVLGSYVDTGVVPGAAPKDVVPSAVYDIK